MRQIRAASAPGESHSVSRDKKTPETHARAREDSLKVEGHRIPFVIDPKSSLTTKLLFLSAKDIPLIVNADKGDILTFLLISLSFYFLLLLLFPLYLSIPTFQETRRLPSFLPCAIDSTSPLLHTQKSVFLVFSRTNTFQMQLFFLI